MSAQATRSLATAALLLLAASCASPPPPLAWIEVETVGGAATPPPAALPVPTQVQVILDLTLSMERPLADAEATRLEAAREAAARFLESLPDQTEVGLQVVGLATGATCPPPVWFSTPAREATPRQLALGLRALEARSEGSLGEALARVERAIERAGELSAWRLVVFSDLDPACDGDPCPALGRLLELGTPIDVVVLGAEPPACLGALDLPSAPAVPEAFAPAPPPAFRVEAAPATEAEGAPAGEGAILVRGRAGEGALGVPPGRAYVVLELDPPFRIGPVELREGFVTTVRAVDFPGAGPSWRAWGVGRHGTSDAEGGAAP